MDEFRFTFLPIFPDDGLEPYHSRTVVDYDLAKSMLDEVARYTLYLHKEDIMHDYSNIGYIEKKVDDEWIEIDD